MSKILVVDDQKTVCYSLQRFLQSEGYDVHTATSGEDALSVLNDANPDLVIMDVRMPEMDGLEVLRRIKESHPKVQVIMMTAFSTTEKAIEAIKLGAYDYLTKPFDNDELLIRAKDAIKTREMMEEVVTFDEVKDYAGGERIIGKSPAMLDIYKQIGRAAPTDATVLIKGENGTGKELVARAIYHYSNRSSKPFLAINCAAIPEQLLESELFGYERGAFTGADFKRIGKFEQCNGGTIFLDEIGDMPVGLQAKLLRILQDGKFQRLGGTETIETNVRIIAATNKDIEDMVKNNTFREDLYYRINVVTINVPPLRERKEDIKELVHYFIQKYNKKLGKTIKGITADALKKLEEHAWPGNVRELENVIQKAMVFCNSDYLSMECCEGLHVQNLLRSSCASIEEVIQNIVELAFKDGCQERFQDIVSTLEKSMVKRAMELTKGNQVHAARLLGISRNTLRKKLGEE
ncbi:MAG: sigma-54 dependent transcriptional regulator [Thermodesulfovibrionales bacterium]|jgi:two-component system NtrC family response regulator/two-component system nitrogen regulation response regulator GlnG|nr:sigma-54 dependent transcriptional regulator [Thermodesulfovibrionales bacterium]RJR13257.1 MAG: sigma-54-dependent Fis family transcriptional regulator [Candidatus Parcubacteria bacterium]